MVEDQYAVMHCAVNMYRGGIFERKFRNLRECADFLGVSVSKVRNLLFFESCVDNVELDIAADSNFKAVLVDVISKSGLKKVVRIVRNKRGGRAELRRYEIGIGGIMPLGRNLLLKKVDCAFKMRLRDNVFWGHVVKSGDCCNIARERDEVLYLDSCFNISFDDDLLLVRAEEVLASW